MWKVALCDLAGLGLLHPWNLPESSQLGLPLHWAAHIKSNVFESISTSMLLAGKQSPVEMIYLKYYSLIFD